MRAPVLRAALGAVALALLAWPSAAAALPGEELSPIRGVAYQPAPSDYKHCPACPYFDTDFFNGDFKQLWGQADGGRNDLAKMATDLGANLLRLYDWNPSRDHLGFLNDAYRNGLRVAVPISNYFVESDPNAAADIEAIVRGVYVDKQGNPSTVPHPAVPIWTVGNEFDIPPGQSTEARRAAAAKVARATALLVAAEQKVGATVRLPVSAPVSFAAFDGQPSGISATRMAIEAMRAEPGLPDDFLASRFAAAVNTFNTGADLHQWLAKFSSLVPGTAVWFSELGINLGGSCNGFPLPCETSESQQAAYVAGQWSEAPPGTPAIYLGAAAFEFSNEPWKGGSEATFGLAKFAPGNSPRRVPTKRGEYLVDELVDKPSWDALRDAFQPRILVGGDGRLVGMRIRQAKAGGLRIRQAGGLRIRRNDIVMLDRGTGRVRRVLNGARTGLAGNAIDAFTYDRRGHALLISLARPQRLPGVGRVGATDVLRFSPRTGRFKLALRGARVGLGGPRRDIRALALTPSGRLVIATRGAWRRGKLAVGPHDLLVLRPPRRGSGGVTRWRPYLRGAAAGLTRPGERIDSVWVDPWSGAIYLGTTGRFAARGVRGADDDAVVCERRRRGGCDLRLGWRGSRHGLRGADLSGFALVRGWPRRLLP